MTKSNLPAAPDPAPDPKVAVDNPKVAAYVGMLDNAITLLTNPALGLGDIGRVIALLNFAGNVVRDIARGAGELKAVDDYIKAMVKEGRSPSDEEWAALASELQANDAEFTRIKDSL